MALVDRKKMCSQKVSFTHRVKAQAVADKYGQRVYECPICFCWHTTGREKWEDEFIRVEEHKRQLDDVRHELGNKIRMQRLEITELHKKIKNYKEEIKKWAGGTAAKTVGEDPSATVTAGPVTSLAAQPALTGDCPMPAVACTERESGTVKDTFAASTCQGGSPGTAET